MTGPQEIRTALEQLADRGEKHAFRLRGGQSFEGWVLEVGQDAVLVDWAPSPFYDGPTEEWVRFEDIELQSLAYWDEGSRRWVSAAGGVWPWGLGMTRSDACLLAVALIVFLLVGLAIGYWFGRASAPATSLERSSGEPSASTEPSADELKWAREAAEGYLRAAGPKGFYHAATSAWTSQAFRDRVAKSSLSDYWFTDWRIEEEKLSPQRDEVLFRGVLKATWSTSSGASSASQLTPPRHMAFTVRTVKDPQGGRWRVDWAQFDGDKKK